VKVLFIHNQYQVRGGEDAVFDQGVELLSGTEEVKALTFKNLSGIKGAIQFLFSIWNIFTASKIKKVIRQFQPDLIHLHNWHYAIGPIIIRTAYKKRIPIIITIHNYRLLCPSATLLNRDSLFLNSLYVAFPWKAIRNKVYRNSYLQTFWLSFVIWFHKKIGTWKMVDRYIVLTDFAKKLFLSSSFGVSETHFSVLPNFIKDPKLPKPERSEYFLYLGRLSEEKGIRTLLKSFKYKETDLYIAGEGNLKEEVIRAGKENPRLHYLGLLDLNSVMERMAYCSALIFPSLWYEGMPMTIIEAFALGTPVIASNLGAMSSMIKDGNNGIHFSPGNAIELSEKIDYWINLDKSDKSRYSINARTSYEEIYTPDLNMEGIISIYNQVIKNISGN
jgi:glycosyltransferase involved in cell wall biosynthesis